MKNLLHTLFVGLVALGVLAVILVAAAWLMSHALWAFIIPAVLMLALLVGTALKELGL